MSDSNFDERILTQMLEMQERIYYLQLEIYRSMILTGARESEEKRLIKYGYSAFSKFDEDGILKEIFNRIGTSSKTFIELKIFHSSVGHNSLNLLMSDWRGLWINYSNTPSFNHDDFANYMRNGQLKILLGTVPSAKIDEIIQKHTINPFIDLLSIDLATSAEYWQAIESIRPCVVLINYDARFRPPISTHSNIGSSLSMLEKIAQQKYYFLVGCTFSGTNAFFVRNDLCEDKFCTPFNAENHFEPPRHFNFPSIKN